MEPLIFTPTDFVATLNQTLEYAYPHVVIEGELAELRVSKNRWVYFSVKDELASVQFFGLVYQLPGPLADGLTVRVTGAPRLHPRFGFSISFSSIVPVGEGSIKKAADLLQAKLTAEGLFAPERKRLLPDSPSRVGLITAASSAACADFMKVLNERWGGVEVELVDCLVQGERAPGQLARALEYFNQAKNPPEVLVMIRGGGGAQDLAGFNDERVVRAVAASRIPTLVAIGHEVDVNLAELAADCRASTPTAAAALLVPDKRQVLAELEMKSDWLAQAARQLIREQNLAVNQTRQALTDSIKNQFASERTRLENYQRVVEAFNPRAVLERGYALVKRGEHYLTTAKQARLNDRLELVMSGGSIIAKTEQVNAKNIQ